MRFPSVVQVEARHKSRIGLRAWQGWMRLALATRHSPVRSAGRFLSTSRSQLFHQIQMPSAPACAADGRPGRPSLSSGRRRLRVNGSSPLSGMAASLSGVGEESATESRGHQTKGPL